MELQFEESFTFGTGRISFTDGWYRVDAPVQSIKIEDHKVIITTPCIDFTHHVDTVPLFPHIVELRRGVIDMDFGATHCPMRRGANSIVFEVVAGSFDKYGVLPEEAPAASASRASSSSSQSNLRGRCGHCPQHGASVQRGQHIRFGPNGDIVESSDPYENEEKYGHMDPLPGREIIDVSSDDARPHAPIPAALRAGAPSYIPSPLMQIPILQTRRVGLVPHEPPLPPPSPPSPSAADVSAAALGVGPNESQYRHRAHTGDPDPMEFMSDAITVTEAHTNEECVICRCIYEVGEEKRWLPCFHAFHAPCIDRWVHMERDDQEAAQCPICKTTLDELAARMHVSS